MPEATESHHFTVWKVEIGIGLNTKPWFTYSLRERKTDPVIILDERQFAMLFPSIDTNLVPVAPKTAAIAINAEMMGDAQ